MISMPSTATQTTVLPFDCLPLHTEHTVSGKIDVFAPGEEILSTLPGGNTGYMSGTSQATPCECLLSEGALGLTKHSCFWVGGIPDRTVWQHISRYYEALYSTFSKSRSVTPFHPLNSLIHPFQ